MPTTVTSTIKSSGGDYSTLPSWEDDKDGDIVARDTIEEAQIFSGFDVGRTVVGGWTTDATRYPRIFSTLAERHDGVSGGAGIDMDSAGATFGIQNSGTDFLRIEGLRVEISSGTNFNGILSQGDEPLVDSCLIIIDGVQFATGISMGFSGNGFNGTIRNNIIYGDGQTVTNAAISAGTSGVFATVAASHDIFNNTIHDLAGKGLDIFESEFSGSATETATATNNITTDCTTSDFSDTVTKGTITGSYQCSSDATADDWGATGALINKTASDIYESESTGDLRLKPSSICTNVGTTIGSFDHDALHIDSDNWRPQDGTWDMGAHEVELLKNIVGSFTKTNTLSATITGIGVVAGSFTKTNTLSATLTGDGALAGAFTKTNTLSAAIEGIAAIAGSYTKTNTLSAAIEGIAAIVGSYIKTNTFSGALVGDGALAGTYTMTHTFSATLIAAGAMDGTFTKTNTFSGLLIGDGSLAGTYTKTNTFSLAQENIFGNFTKISTLSGTATSRVALILRSSVVNEHSLESSVTNTHTLRSSVIGDIDL